MEQVIVVDEKLLKTLELGSKIQEPTFSTDTHQVLLAIAVNWLNIKPLTYDSSR